MQYEDAHLVPARRAARARQPGGQGECHAVNRNGEAAEYAPAARLRARRRMRRGRCAALRSAGADRQLVLRGVVGAQLEPARPVRGKGDNVALARDPVEMRADAAVAEPQVPGTGVSKRRELEPSAEVSAAQHGGRGDLGAVAAVARDQPGAGFAGSLPLEDQRAVLDTHGRRLGMWRERLERDGETAIGDGDGAHPECARRRHGDADDIRRMPAGHAHRDPAGRSLCVGPLGVAERLHLPGSGPSGGQIGQVHLALDRPLRLRRTPERYAQRRGAVPSE